MTVLVTLALVATAESYWRSQGHRATVVDDKDLWCVQRSKINDDPKCAALLGASRIQLGFETKMFAQQYPDWTLAHLAIDGSSPLSTLKHLSEDEQFKGVVICSINMRSVNAAQQDDQLPWVEHWQDKWSFNRSVNRRLANLAQEQLVFIQPTFSITELLQQVAKGDWPEPFYLLTAADRSRAADYSMVDLQTHTEFRVDHARKQFANDPEQLHDRWLAQTKLIKPWVTAIQQRGGTVVFVRLPTTGKLYEIEEQFTPRKQFFDQFANLTGGKTIHFQDVPGLAELHCPEGSHVDQRDKAKLTQALLDELVRREILPAASPSR